MFTLLNALNGFIVHFICVDYAPETLLVRHYLDFPDFRAGARKSKQNSMR